MYTSFNVAHAIVVMSYVDTSSDVAPVNVVISYMDVI
jgi:tRNA C32,U32 (ribose-2'-O)-methylase TrmJ